MSEKEKSRRGSHVLNLLEYYATFALRPPQPDNNPSRHNRYQEARNEETAEEKMMSEKIRRELELPGPKVITVEDRGLLSTKFHKLRPAYNNIVDVLDKTMNAENSNIVYSNINILMDSAMWIGAYVFVTDASQESIEMYTKRKQTEPARRRATERFVAIMRAVEEVADGQELIDSDDFAAKIQNPVADRLGLSKYKAPSLSAIRRAIRELKK
jgi:hypothetical protein